MTGGGHGHGCGHNLLGSGALLAACEVKDRLEATGTPGRVRYYGCPAEEGGAAKAFIVRDGAFDDVNAAVTWHPGGMTRVDGPLAVALHWHKAASQSFSAVNFKGPMSVPAWLPSQNGWLVDRPHWHQK